MSRVRRVRFVASMKPLAPGVQRCYSINPCERRSYCQVGRKRPHLIGAYGLLTGRTTEHPRPEGVPFLSRRLALVRRRGFFCAGRTRRRRCSEIARYDSYRVNNEINTRVCRLIDENGDQLGLFDVRDAQRLADERGMDLVEIAAQANPPVCRIMDFRKFVYEEKRREKASRKNQSRIEVKEMKFRPKIDVGDYETKKGHVIRFLRKGNRVKITIMFRGREMAHPDQGLKVLDRLADDLKDVATVDQKPKMEGRNMHMTISPIKGAFDKKPEAADDQDEA